MHRNTLINQELNCHKISQWCSCFTGMEYGMTILMHNVIHPLTDGLEPLSVKCLVTAELKAAQHYKSYWGPAVLGRKHSPVCLCLGNFFFLSSHPPQGSPLITVRYLSPSLSAACAEPSEHPDEAAIICVKSQNMEEFNQDILKVLADAKQTYLELPTPLFLSYSVCFQARNMCLY